jgi:hypothetical protein
MDESRCNRHVCHGCGVTAPDVATDFTLVSVRHGWRLLRRKEGDTIVLEWRCRACWAEMHAERTKAAG